MKHPSYFLQRAAHPVVWALPISLELSTSKRSSRPSRVFLTDCLVTSFMDVFDDISYTHLVLGGGGGGGKLQVKSQAICHLTQ